jgi:hypothetical protein
MFNYNALQLRINLILQNTAFSIIFLKINLCICMSCHFELLSQM